MQKEVAELIVSLIDDEEAAYLYEGYSGRGMMGDKTTGVVFSYGYDMGDVVVAMLEQPEKVNEWVDDFDIRAVSGFSRDSMGRGTIYY